MGKVLARMSLTRPQQILIKRAQAEAGVSDADYRDALAVVSGMPDCRSSTDRRLTDEHMDAVLAYFEAIFWRAADADAAGVQRRCKGVAAVFKTRGFWAGRNRKGNTSRDRFVGRSMEQEIEGLERELAELGFGLAYVRAIQNNIQPFSLVNYAAALRRTVASKHRKTEQPF